MFLGEYKPNITDGNRAALPKKIRDEIGKKDVILSRGFEKCVFGYKKSDWEKEAGKFVEAPISDPKIRKIRRYMFSGAMEVALDSQGRFVIPGSLKMYAQIKDSVVIIGAGDHFEIWDEKIWTKHLSDLEKEV